MRGKQLHIILIAFLAFLLSSCSIRRFVPEGKYLVKSNKVIIEKKGTTISKSGVSKYITLKPYKNSFTTNIPTWVYYKSEQKPRNVFWRWLNNNFGKEPVYYSKAEADHSADQMMRYLDKVGYFHSKVTHEVKTKGKKAKVKYFIHPTTPYYINKIDYNIDDSLIATYIMRDKEKFPVVEGDIYNEFLMSDQRELVTERLKNSGYYFFNRENVRYQVDSNFMNHTLAITMNVNNNKLSNKQYTINEVSIYPDFSLFKMNDKPSDSASLTVELGRRKIRNTIDVYYYNKPQVHPQTFKHSIQIIEGYPYNLRSVTGTYQAMNDLPLFNNVNIMFDTVPNDSLNLLNCRITMQQSDINSFTVQAEGTNSDGDLGIKGSLSYTNKNIFHGAEILQISLKTGIEAQSVVRLGGDTLESNKTFNTKEFGVTASLLFPRFLSPIPMRTFTRDYLPTTSISVGFNSQIRYYYSRYISSASFSYDWKSSYRFKQTFTPIYFNGVKIDNINPVFQAFLDAETNQRKKDQYTNHLLLGMRYSFVFNTQRINQKGSFFYLRADFESSGNLLSLLNKTKLITQNGDHHEIFGIRYAQYFRTSFDVRQHIKLNQDSWLVFRQFIGLGLPYGNSKDLPFERSFYAGGANGLRGWGYRGVGPGGFNPINNDIEKIGDLHLELNAEYRFPIYNIVNGAVFADAGNVWTFNPSFLMPNAEFRFDKFYKQFALDAGFGLRFDVSFLLFRMDIAYAMRNTYANASGNHWRFDQPLLKNIRIQFGIGYPF